MAGAEIKVSKELSENEIGTILIEVAIDVHRHLGPGLLESVYEAILAYELSERGLVVLRQVPITIHYKGIIFDEAFRADLLINGKVVVELKSLATINNAHRKQIQTYVNLSGLKLGYLLNFGAGLMKDGIERAVNGLEEDATYKPSRRAAENVRKPNG